MNITCPMLFPWIMTLYYNKTLRMTPHSNGRNCTIEECAFAVCRPQRVTFFTAQHTHRMSSFLVWKLECLCQIRSVKQMRFLHEVVILSAKVRFFFRKGIEMHELRLFFPTFADKFLSLYGSRYRKRQTIRHLAL